ncbi:ATP synthase peripheral stalk subunit F6, mitochondrial-like [Ciona intestinalis]
MASRSGVKLFSGVVKSFSSRQIYSRNFGASSIALGKLDPVQQIFVDQIKKYKDLSAKQGGGPVEVGPDYKQSKDDAIDRLSKMYNVGDPMKFPEFNFAEPDLEQQNISSLGDN